MLQPEKYEAHDRNQEIAVKNDAGVSRGEIVRRDHLIDVTAGRAPEEAGRPNDGREPQIEASPERGGQPLPVGGRLRQPRLCAGGIAGRSAQSCAAGAPAKARWRTRAGPARKTSA